MSILSSIRTVLDFVLRRQRAEREMEEELHSHLQRRMDDLERQGLSRPEAERQARIDFGGYQRYKEECREALGTRFLSELIADVRYGLRQLRRNPAFTAVAIITLALGIGANTAIFSAIDAVMLKFLPVSHPEQLVFLRWQSSHSATDYFPYQIFDQLSKHNQVFTGLLAFHSLNLATLVDSTPGLAAGQLVSGNYFSVLGVKPVIGRTFTSREDQIRGADPYAVISYRYWENRFGGSPSAVGHSIELNGVPFTIIGVMPPTFFGLSVGDSRDLWIPLMMQAQVMDGKSLLNDPKSWWLQVMARRKPEIPGPQAAAAINVLYQRYAREQAGTHLSHEVRNELAHEHIALLPAGRGLSSLRDRLSEPLIVLMALVGLVLLIACANIASLVLARAAARRRELAVRIALGAGRLRLFRQLLTESLLLAALGGALGLLFARWGDDLLLALMSGAGAPVALGLQMNSAVLIFTAAIALGTGLLFGCMPAGEAARLNVNVAIKPSVGGSSPSAARRPHWETRKLLVIGEVAMALLLLAGSGMLIRSLQKLKDVSPGFKEHGVLLVTVDPTLIGYRGNRLVNFYKQANLAVSALPGVQSVSLSALSPMTNARWRTGVFVQGPIPGAQEQTTARLNFVGPGYFHTLEIPLLEGREFTPRDDTAAPKVAIINEAMARFYFGDESAVGRRLSFISPGQGEIEIVGVARNTKLNSLREATPHMMYVPYLQTPPASLAYSMTAEVRTAGNPEVAVGAVRQAIRRIDPNIPILGFTTLTQQVDESLAQERLVARISTLFGLLALFLASVGLYGVMAYTVARRTGEIGIRMALGARRLQVLWMVLREALKLVAAGIVFGIPLIVVFGRLISNQLYGISPADPLSILGATALLAVIAALATYIPARRAAKVDPTVALRHE